MAALCRNLDRLAIIAIGLMWTAGAVIQQCTISSQRALINRQDRTIGEAEREACARIAEEAAFAESDVCAAPLDEVARKIRARGKEDVK